MKLKILKHKLKEGLSIVERTASRSLTLPILNNVLVESEKNFLKLVTTDLEVAIKWWSLAKVEKEGKITVPVRVFSNLTNLLEEKPIELEKEDLSLKVETEIFRTKLKGIDAAEFPIIPKIIEGEIIQITAKRFCEGLSQVVQIPVLSSARPEISGIFLSFEKNTITMVGTDSFRLGEKKLFLREPLPLDREYSLILPQKAAKEVINIFANEKHNLKICFSPNQILFESKMEETEHPKIQLISKLIEGEYPNYQAIFPKKSKTEIVLVRDEFLSQLRAASIFASKMNEVTIKTNLKKREIEIFSQNPELGEYRSALPGKVSGKETQVSFNWKFLIDGLTNLKTPEVIFELNDEEGPAVLKPKGDQTYTYLVMPVKTS
jgi:DNA polymerase-3 subunit beta